MPLTERNQLIMEAIRTGSPDQAAQNLMFLVDAGLIHGDSAKALRAFLARHAPGQGAKPPGVESSQSVVGQHIFQIILFPDDGSRQTSRPRCNRWSRSGGAVKFLNYALPCACPQKSAVPP